MIELKTTSNIDLLTEKIYQEGLERAKKEEKRILDEAKEEAEQIIEDARLKAEGIISEANKNAEAKKRNTLSEIKLAGEQAVVKVKQKIREMLQDNILDKPMNQLFTDQQFLKELILTIAEHTEKPDQAGLILPERLKDNLDNGLVNSIKKVADGLTLQFDNKLKGGFRINYKDKGYIITFTDEDFAEFFKPFLNKKTADILFK